MNPQIQLFGVSISEPTTLLTDYAVAVVCAWLAARLVFSNKQERHLSRQAWAIGFVLVGSGLFLGGTAHGFAAYLSDGALLTIWKVTFCLAGLSMAAMVAGSIVGLISSRMVRIVLHCVNALGLLFFLAFVAGSDDNFLLVIIDSVAALAVIALLGAWAAARRGLKGGLWLVAGVLVYVLSAVIQQSQITLHKFFNHNDLYHLVLMIGLFFLFRGAASLQDQRQAVATRISDRHAR